MQRSKLGLAILVAAGLLVGNQAAAGPILSAVDAVINSGGPGFGTLVETFNQTGLFTPYVSGVTDFDTYIAGDPQHTLVFAGNEWFSNSGTTSASVTYDLGAATGIDAIAWWSEDASGVGVLDVFVSLDGVTFTSLLSGLLPTDNPINFDYGADVFSFGAVSARYIRFDMSDCPQNPGEFPACAIGEVAFRGATVPEPATLALLGVALGGLVLRRSRKG